MPNFKILDNFQGLIDQYNIFVFDIFGIIYDGVAPFQEALSVIQAIRNQNKRIILLSNSPRRSSVIEGRMAKIGLSIGTGDILTSGECFYRDTSVNISLQGKKLFVIGDDVSMLDGFGFDVVDSVAAADYLYFSLLSLEFEFNQLWQDKINQAIVLDKPAICANPDEFIFEQNKIVYTAGHYARIYESLGGSVMYYGKPFKKMYDCLASYIGGFEGVLVIGDALATDIKGANSVGLDSLWVLTRGIHKMSFVDQCNSKSILGLCNEYGAFPEYVMQSLFLSKGGV